MFFLHTHSLLSLRFSLDLIYGIGKVSSLFPRAGVTRGALLPPWRLTLGPQAALASLLASGFSVADLTRSDHSPWGGWDDLLGGDAVVPGESYYRVSLGPPPRRCIPGFYEKVLDKSVILTAVLASLICSEQYYFVLVKSACSFFCFISVCSMSYCYI